MIEPCPYCGEEGYDRVYIDERGTPRHDACRNDVSIETLERVAPLDMAWDEAEEAKPEGWCIELGDRPNGDYWAQAYGPEIDGRHPRADGSGATPAAALRALTALLRAR